MNRAILILASALLYVGAAWAGTSINTLGSPDGVAINGFDVVAFHKNKAIKGSADLMYEWSGAKWRFSSLDNLEAFKASPEKYAPQYGGHCALAMSDGYVSKKPTEGEFELYQGKLYLFPPGKTPDGARNTWRYGGGGPYSRVRSADGHWQKIKQSLEGN